MSAEPETDPQTDAEDWGVGWINDTSPNVFDCEQEGGSPDERMIFPGEGSSGSDCGDFAPYAFCNAELHGGETDYIYKPHQCKRRGCPRCWRIWAARRTFSATARLAVGRHDSSDGPRGLHVQISPPQVGEDSGEKHPDETITTVEELYEGRRKATKLAKEHGMNGFATVVHAYRATDHAKAEFVLAKVDSIGEIDPSAPDEDPTPGDMALKMVHDARRRIREEWSGRRVGMAWLTDDYSGSRALDLLHGGKFDAYGFEGGIWDWIRSNDCTVDEQRRWSPHYHVVGTVGPTFEPSSPESDDGWNCKNIRSLERFYLSRSRVPDGESGPYNKTRKGYADMAGLFRYLLSHATFPEGETRQLLTWAGSLHSTNLDPEEVLTGSQWDRVRGWVERVVNYTLEDEEDAEGEECPVDGCDGLLVMAWDAKKFINSNRQALSEETIQRLYCFYWWQTGDRAPPAGVAHPSVGEEAGETLDRMHAVYFGDEKPNPAETTNDWIRQGGLTP